MGLADGIMPKQMGEESLREILSVLRDGCVPAHVGINGKPVRLAQSFKRPSRFLRNSLPSRKHDAPPGRGEVLRVSSIRAARMGRGRHGPIVGGALVHNPW